MAAPFGSVAGAAATVATAPLMQQHEVRREVDEDNLFGSAPSRGAFHDDHENYPDDSAPPPAPLIQRSPSPPPAPLIQRSRSPSHSDHGGSYHGGIYQGNDFDGESGEFDESLDESDDPDLP